SALQATISLPETKYPDPTQTYAFYTRLQERLSALPGVEHVALGWTLPIYQFLTSRNYVVEGRDPPPAGREPQASVNGVTPSYLHALKIKRVSGRNFTDADTLTSPAVAIINETMARALFPDGNAIGQHIGGTDPKNRGWTEIVGIMPDLRFTIAFAPSAN